MPTPSDLTGYFSTGYFNSFAAIGKFIGWILVAVLICALIWGVFILMQYRIRVTYFPVQGDPSKLGEVNLGTPKKDRGRRLKQRGIEVFRLLMARKTVKDVPYKLQYPDGVYLIRKSRDEFEAISRPVLGNPSITLTTADQGLQLWAQLRAQSVRKRFVDEDMQRKQMIIFVSVILGCLIFSGIVIWLSYVNSSYGVEEAGKVAQALESVANRIGVGGP